MLGHGPVRAASPHYYEFDTIPTRLASPLCQRSCRLNRIGTFGGADSRKWLDTDKRTKIG